MKTLLPPFTLPSLGSGPARFATLFFTLLFSSALSWAQQYYPSQFFGIKGTKTIDFNDSDMGRDVLLLPNGKLVVSGTGFPQSPLKTSRLSSNCGDLDSTYGLAGKSILNLTFDQYILEMNVQQDGKVVGFGYERSSNAGSASIPTVWRLKDDGRLDSSFGNNGRAANRFDPVSSGSFFSGHLYPDGRILAIGICSGNINGGVTGIGMMRYMPNGSYDTTFGNQGKVVVPKDVNCPRGRVLPNGDILVSMGVNAFASTYSLQVARFDSTGSLVTSWGTNGFATTPHFMHFSYFDGAFSGMQSNGKLILAGDLENTDPLQHFVYRFNPDGKTDSTFGINGILQSNAANGERVLGMSIQQDNKILVCGRSQGGGPGYVARYTANGKLDSAFASNGKLEYGPGFSGFDSFAFGKAIYDPADSTIWVVGYNSWGGARTVVIKFTTAAHRKWVNLGSDISVCAGTLVTLNAQNEGNSFLWTTTDTTQTISPTISGTYGVHVTDGIGCSLSDTVQVTFNPIPAVPVITQTGGSLSTTASGSLQWLLNGQPITGATSAIFTPTASGTYSLLVTVAGCIATSAPFIVTSNESLKTNLGIQVYPNPVQNFLHFHCDAPGNTSIKLFDLKGKAVSEVSFSTADFNIEMNRLPDGLYLLQFKNEKGLQSIRISKN